MFKPCHFIENFVFVCQTVVKKAIESHIVFPFLRGLRVPSGVLFYGEPGNGKTKCAENVSQFLSSVSGVSWKFYNYDCSSFLQQFVGEGENSLKNAFKLAKENSPCILFFDEIDSICSSRNSKIERHYVTLTSAFLSLFNDIPQNVIVIGATNRLESIDGAFRRYGRFEKEFFFGFPDFEDREHMLRYFSKHMPNDVNFGLIASKTYGFSVAKLKQLVEKASFLCIKDGELVLKHHHFEENIVHNICSKLVKTVTSKYDIKKSTLFVGKNAFVVGQCLAYKFSCNEAIIFVPRIYSEFKCSPIEIEKILENAKLSNSTVIAYDTHSCLELVHFFDRVINVNEHI